MNDILRKFISVSRKLSCIGGNNQLYDCSALKRFRAIKSYKQKMPSTKLLHHAAGKLITTQITIQLLELEFHCYIFRQTQKGVS